MNKAELVRQLAERANLSRAAASRAVEALFSAEEGIIAGALRSGETVQITGFGSFEAKRREARKGRNPRTGKEIGISASTSAGFRSGKSLKDTRGGPKGPGVEVRIRGGGLFGDVDFARTHGSGDGM